MSPSELEILFMSKPENAIQLTLASGDLVTLKSTKNVVIDGLSLVMIDVRDEDKRRGKWRLISIPNIVQAETVEGRPPPPSDARRSRGPRKPK
jgi:hypothetical protein